MAYWLIKSEPGSWSWDDHVKEGVAEWDGVRNHQAANNMKAMRIGDKVFFYHSVTEKQVVGMVEVVKEYYPDPSDASGRFGMVDFKALRPFVTPVGLAEIKAEPRLQNLALIRHSRLSVMPVGDQEWRLICAMGKTQP
jgi:predicted RNA-binding protein with PUA-like domain